MDKKKSDTKKPEAKKPVQETEAKAPVAASKPTTEFASNNALVKGVLFIACAGLGLAGWNAYHAHRQQSQQVTSQQQASDHFQQLSAGVDKQDQQLGDLNEKVGKLDALQQQQHELLNAYSRSLQKVVKKSAMEQSDFSLEEVNFLVRTARLQLQWRRDVSSAISVLQLADEQLRQQGSVKLNGLRQAVAHNLADLQAVELPDRTGILSKITALQGQLDKLPLMGQEGLRFQADDSGITASEAQRPVWRKALDQSLQAVKKVIVIREREQAITPLLQPEQQRLLAQRLALLLQQAEWGLIQGDQAIYSNSLLQVKALVEKFFDTAAKVTTAVKQEIDELAAINIAPELPDLTKTQALIEQHLQQRAQSALQQAE